MSDDPTEAEREAMVRRIAYSVSRALKIVGPPEDAGAERIASAWPKVAARPEGVA